MKKVDYATSIEASYRNNAFTGIATSSKSMKVLIMAMSKKDLDKKRSAKREKLEELEKQASAGSKDAKKKLAKEKKKK